MQQEDSENPKNEEKKQTFAEKFAHLISPTPSKWMEKAKWREENKNWLDIACHVSLNILDEMKKQNLTKHDLVNRSGLSIDLVNNILRGKENLDLKTIAALEEAFDDKVDLLNRTVE